jgi:hypothetical protein
MYFVNDIYKAEDIPNASYVVMSPYPCKSKLRLHRSTVVCIPDEEDLSVAETEERLEAVYLASDSTANCSIHNVQICMHCIFKYPAESSKLMMCSCLSEEYFDSIEEIHDDYNEEYDALLDHDFTSEPGFSYNYWYELKVAANISFALYGNRTIPAPRLSGSDTEPTEMVVERDIDRLEYMLWLGANMDVMRRLLGFVKDCTSIRAINYFAYIRCAERDALSRTLQLYVKLDAGAARAIAREFYPN